MLSKPSLKVVQAPDLPSHQLPRSQPSSTGGMRGVGWGELGVGELPILHFSQVPLFLLGVSSFRNKETKE